MVFAFTDYINPSIIPPSPALRKLDNTIRIDTKCYYSGCGVLLLILSFRVVIVVRRLRWVLLG